MTSKKKSSKKPITKLSDYSQSLVKQLWIPIAGVIGAIVLINQLVEIWTGNPTRTNYIIASVLLAIWLIVLVTLTFGNAIREQRGFFSKKTRLGKKNVPIYKLLSGTILLTSIICIIGGIVTFTRQKNEIARTKDEKIIILIAIFDDGNDGKDLLDIHNSIVEQLRLSLSQYEDTDVITADEVITVRQGSEYARELGQKHQADFILWGRYRADIENSITIYIEYLSPSTFGVSTQRQTYKPTVSTEELKTFELRQNLGSSLSALINFLSGLAQYKDGNYTDAISRFTQALSEPEWENATTPKSLTYFFIGQSYKALERHNEAIEYLSYSIEFDPLFFLAYNERGHTFNHLQQFDKAMADYNSAIELNPLSAGVYNNRGFLFDELGEYEKALQDYTKAIELNPLFTIAYFNRGSLYDTLKQYAKPLWTTLALLN